MNSLIESSFGISTRKLNRAKKTELLFDYIIDIEEKKSNMDTLNNELSTYYQSELDGARRLVMQNEN